MLKTITMYLSSDKETNWETAQEIGLSEDAYFNHFKNALYEDECDVEVNNETGESKLIAARET